MRTPIFNQNSGNHGQTIYPRGERGSGFLGSYYSNLNTEDSESDSIDPFEESQKNKTLGSRRRSPGLNTILKVLYFRTGDLS